MALTGAAGASTQGREDGLVELTLLFSDIEGSTRLWEADPATMPAALTRHFALLDDAIAAHEGRVIDRAGDGVFAAFGSAAQAASAAVQAQRALAQETWPTSAPLKVRMGLHTGSVLAQGPALTGTQVHRAARIANAAHGGQVVVSDVTRALIDGVLPAAVTTRPLGAHGLRDLDRPEDLHQLVISGLPDRFPALRTDTAFRHELPTTLSGFIGRDRERADIGMAMGDHRLVTLTGAGGVGKTRLALQLALDHVERRPTNAWLVELGAVTAGDDVIHEFLTRLAVVRADDDPVGALVARLNEAPALLVVDNCEHVIDVAAELLERLLRSCAELTVLATSREPLGIEGERVVRVASLQVGAEPASGEAQRLFVERARASDPSWQPSPAELEDVTAICRRLDGVPLAIELAAARVRALAVAQIRERLEHSFALLATTSRSAVERQRTLEATVAWSHDLLDGDEKLALAFLSVFIGTFELSAAEAVLADVTDRAPLDLVSALVDKSLLQSVRHARAAGYRMLETVRFYAREHLVRAGLADAAYAGHLRWAVDAARAADGLLMLGVTGREETEELLQEFPLADLRAAIRYAEEVRDVDAGLSIVVDLYSLVGLGSQRETLPWLQRFLELAAAHGADPVLQSRAHGCISEVLAFHHDAAGALREATRSMELLDGVDDSLATGWAHHNHAMALWVGGDLEGARDADERALQALADAGHPIGLARCSYELAVWHIAHGSVEEARRHQTRMSQIRTPAGGVSPLAHVHVLEIEALLALRAGDVDTARTKLLGAVDVQAEVGFGQCVAHLLDHTALCAAGAGDGEGAARLLGAATSVRDDLIGTDVQPFEQVFHDQAVEAARRALGDESYERQVREGGGRSMLSALALAADVLR